ncbi:MAG: hypothetical protein HWN81_07915 [Candidatus Lokiarchaeota archaeon]|nr:hypothetical protein [Candidatus Lokiarchaeota archaeon]
MTDKSIDISKEVYNKIKDLKRKEESVSDFLHRILNKNNLDSKKELEEISQDWEKIEKYLYEDRLKNKITREIEL